MIACGFGVRCSKKQLSAVPAASRAVIDKAARDFIHGKPLNFNANCVSEDPTIVVGVRHAAMANSLGLLNKELKTIMQMQQAKLSAETAGDGSASKSKRHKK